MVETRAKGKGLARDAPAAVGLDNPTNPTSSDDESEWEYEYSETETETYYLTVELSYPEFVGAAKKIPQHSRAGYYKKWMARNAALPEPATTAPSGFGPSARGSVEENGGNTNNGQEDEDEEPVPAAEEEDMTNLDPNLDPRLFAKSDAMESGAHLNHQKDKPSSAASQQAERRPDEPRDNQDEPDDDQAEEEDQLPEDHIQILNLHSKRPIFSYRGHVFEGQWAEMIGTDMILAHHEEGFHEKLPALRNLAEDVDLLGASASRILTTKKILKPKAREQDSLEPIRKEWNINIPLGRNKDAERAQQANFLERLMALKIKKGQKDNVTVYAKDGAGKDFDDGKDPNFRPRKKRQSVRFGDEEEDNDSGTSARQKRRRQGESRTNAPSALRGILHNPDQSRALSTPTPRHWEDLEAAGGDANEAEEGDGSNNDDEDEDDEDDEDDMMDGEDDNDDDDNNQYDYEGSNNEGYDTTMEAS